MKKKYLWLLIGISLLPINVLATSGKLKKDSIVSCNGQNYGSHGDGHWHVAIQQDNGWYASGEPLAGNPCGGNSYVAPSTPSVNNNNSDSNSNQNNSSSYNSTNNSSSNKQNTVVSKPQAIESKSADTSIKEIRINDEVIPISDHLEYKTIEEKIKIEIAANDNKANVEYEQEKKLEIGSNIYTIKVTAENGDVKNYNVNITRIALSSNKEFKLFYDGKELNKNVDSKKIEDIYINNDITKISFKYKLSDTKSKIKFTGNDKLKVGKNKIKITITAEDDSKDIYTLIVNRNSKAEDIIAKIIVAYIMIIPFLTLAIGIIIQKKNKKLQRTA